MKRVIVLFLILIGQNGLAADISIYKGSFIVHSKTFTFGDNVKIRKEPSVNVHNIIDTLPIGYEVTITEMLKDEYTLNGYRQNWCAVQYHKNGQTHRGYVWGGLLSIGYAMKDGTCFLIGVTEYRSNKGFLAECKVVNKNRLINKVQFEPYGSLSNSASEIFGSGLDCTVYDNLGLDPFENIVKCYFHPPRDGTLFGNIWLGYKKDSLVFIAKENNIRERGVGGESERYIFPKEDGGYKGKVKYIYKKYGFDETRGKDILNKHEEEYYIWNGSTLIKDDGK